VSTHLGCWVSDLVDGQLDAATTEHALAHVAGCARCAEELAAARAAHQALVAARDVAPDPALTERLLALSASIPPAAGDPLRADTPRTWRLEEPAGGPVLTGDLQARHRRLRRRRLTAAGAGGLGLLGVTLLALGQAPVVTPDPSRTAALAALSQAHAGSVAAGGVAAAPVLGAPVGLPDAVRDGDVAAALAWLDGRGWAVPESLPDGYAVTAVSVDGAADEGGADGERHGAWDSRGGGVGGGGGGGAGAPPPRPAAGGGRGARGASR
jgi:hypothetical protein